MKESLIIAGAGGHGKVVADCVLSQGIYQLKGFLDDQLPPGMEVLPGLKILGTIAGVGLRKPMASHFIVAIGKNDIRRKLFLELSFLMKPATVVHPSVVISAFAKIGPGTVILPNSVVNAGAVIGENCILNSLSLVDHDSVLGSHSHLAQGSILGSHCSIREMFESCLGEHIASNSTVL
jgi:sugar O-acyltransferase (sialic acid O-acetyltransferase NeuD family)